MYEQTNGPWGDHGMVPVANGASILDLHHTVPGGKGAPIPPPPTPHVTAALGQGFTPSQVGPASKRAAPGGPLHYLTGSRSPQTGGGGGQQY